jgi:predicted HicB family RNase H-like nuclease
MTTRMVKQNFKDQCSDLTKKFNVQIPCKLAERVEAYASKNKTQINSVVIEALDAFLRKQKNRVG